MFRPNRRGASRFVFRPEGIKLTADTLSVTLELPAVMNGIPSMFLTTTMNLDVALGELRVAPVTLPVGLNFDVDSLAARIVEVSLLANLSLEALTAASGTYGSVMAAGLAFHDAVSGQRFVGAVRQPGVDPALRTWVVNIETGASSQYDGYGFNSYASTGTEYLGAAEDGIYRLEGADDAGVAIDSLAQLPRRNWGAPQKKRIPNVWIGVASDQSLTLRVETDDATNYYSTRSSSTAMKDQRFDLGRGLEATYWTFTLTSPDSFELESITFEPVVLQRRI